MTPSAIVYLMYHELEVPDRPLLRDEDGYRRYVLHENQFADHLQMLKRLGWQGVSVGEALSGASPHRKVVAITFDDGCETDFLIAAPLLRRAGFGATLYIVAGFIDKPGYLCADQLRALADLGFEIGCHSMNHPYLTDCDERQLGIEVVDSRHRLEQFIGRPVEHFSCPGGRWDQRVADMVRRAGYRSMATSRVGANSPVADRFRLARVPAMRDTTMAEFQRVLDQRGMLLRRTQSRMLTAAKGLLGNAMYDRVRQVVLRRGR